MTPAERRVVVQNAFRLPGMATQIEAEVAEKMQAEAATMAANSDITFRKNPEAREVTDREAALVEIIRANPGLTTRELSAMSGISLSSVGNMAGRSDRIRKQVDRDGMRRVARYYVNESDNAGEET